MRLKRLQVQGFKTFANKTEFVFDDGITAIVGPNGSGKSNVMDAIKWVLGEQSSTSLRGKLTEDMIFAGSVRRPRSGFASAILTLDNSNGWLPIEYSEVEIGRRVSRDGSSEYYVNGTKMRLKDIRELLATSGLAQRTYTMIGQGLVDRALSLKADERRELFEEAAGISHYKERREESLRRLRDTQRNIERVNDILEELKPRLQSLKRQATRAESYEQVRLDLQVLLMSWYGFQWFVARDRVLEARRVAKTAETAWKQSQRVLSSFQDKVDGERKRLNVLTHSIAGKEEERDVLRVELENVGRQVAILNERQILIKQQAAEIGRELPDLETQQKQARAELDEATAALNTVQTQLDGERQALNLFEQTYQEQEREIKRAQQLVTALEKKMREAQDAVSQAEGQLTQLRDQLREADSVQFDGAEQTRLDGEVKALTAEVQTLTGGRDGIVAERQEVNQARQNTIFMLNNARKEQKKLEGVANQLEQDLARLEAKADVLNELRQKTDLAGNAEILGRFATVITLPEKWKGAIAAALNNRLEAVIVLDKTNLVRLLDDNVGEIVTAVVRDPIIPLSSTFASHEATNSLGENKVVKAIDVVGFDAKYEDVAALLLNPVLLVETVDEALAVGETLPLGMMAVAADGTVCHAGGVVERANRTSTVLQREQEWLNVNREIETMQKQAAEAQEQAVALSEKNTADQVAIDQLIERERTLQTDEREAAQTLNDAQRQLDRVQQQITYIERQRKEHELTKVRLKERIAQLEQGAAVRHNSVASIKTQLTGADVQLDSLPILEAQQQRANQQQQISTTKTIVDGRRAVVDSRRATLGQIENRIQRQRQRLDDIENQRAAINLTAEQSRLADLTKRVAVLDEQITPLKTSRTEIQERLAEAEAEISIHRKDAQTHEAAYTEARLALNGAETKIDSLKERITADLGAVDLRDEEEAQQPLDLEGVVVLERVAEVEDGLETQIQKQRAQLQRMGAINPDAPKEYAETNERFEFLAEQIDDLHKTEAQLRDVIAELDDLTSREFAKTVEQVNVIFGTMFTQLFGGGSAELHLTNPDDLTVTGVDVVACLPRKRAQGLSMLSGGERSLTAAALIFSLLKVTPPPFCVMDEVDAALDEANINRFREALRDLSLKTQFIVITHNRGTVQAADTIYGISMGGDGVSQVISIKPEDYESS